MSQSDFCEMIVLIALTACFKPDEEYLSLEQVLVRGFAPTESYGRRWIANLISKRIIESKLTEIGSSITKFSNSLVVKAPVSTVENREKYSMNLSKKVATLIKSDFEFILFLKEFALELAACECIEYINFYAEKSRLVVVRASHMNSRLRLLLLECKQKQVFMLLWRAIKFAERECENARREVEFTELMERALSSYLKYKRMSIEIENYDKPRCMQSSILANTVEYFNAALL